MTEKRYSLVYYADKGGAFIKNNETGIEWYHDSRASLLEIVDKLNELAEENHFLKEKEKDMLDYLKQEYDFIYNQKKKHFDDAILVNCYELIEYHIRSMIEHLERL